MRALLCIIILIELLYYHALGFDIKSFLGGLKNSVSYYSLSVISEQCDERWVTESTVGLERDLEKFVYGQDLATEIILLALESHLVKSYRRKPLVLNFHGWPGGGKGYVADFIVKNWFKKGGKSKFVKTYFAKLHFPKESELHNYQKRLQNELEETVYKCPRAMFVFDEVEKYPPYVLDGIKPYLDYNNEVNGYDFRETIFIFISNTGDQLITNITYQKHLEGIPREKLILKDFEQPLKTASFNEIGGFLHSELIRHSLIDYMIPFLPLEREHVALCVRDEMTFQKGNPAIIQSTIREILDSFTFVKDLYSISGCKGVSERVASIIERERRRERRKQHHTEL
ncbi:torsin-like protein [Homalodisca vitripennis]|uniref:torsin-like protein n=1 Tax=Homalodisca vitripennis TaxID=197043 RepID=UPI001EEC097E|nr:torsin-like protein [Homalodisca vitripennis]